MRSIILIICFLISSSFTIGPKNKVNLKKVKGKYVYVPSGKTIVDDNSISVPGFFMMSTEVSNLDYREFLQSLAAEGSEDLLDKYSPNDFGEDYIKTYNNHPSFEDYPVIGISKQAALAYCEWLGNTLTRNKTLGKNISKVEVRLPTEAEWMIAAKAGDPEAVYPWDGNYLRNSKGKKLANFQSIDESLVSYDSATGQYTFVENIEVPLLGQSPVKSSFPNKYGLFNMSGNVSEMVSNGDMSKGGSFKSGGHDIRIQNKKEYSGPSIELGFRPIFTVAF